MLAIPSLLGFSSLLAHQIFAALVGVATVVVVGLAGRSISSDRGGLIAALIAALYPGFWMYERDLLSETLLLLGVATITLAAYRFVAEPTRWRAIGLGALCGLLALIRSEQILLVIVLLAPLILMQRSVSWSKRLASLALACVATVLVIAPWSLYNLGRFDEPVFLSSSFGAAMAQGNCDTAYSGPLLGYYDFNCLGTTAQSGRTSRSSRSVQ